MKLTTKGYYALQSILDMVNNGNERPVRLVDISDRQALPLSYLEQIFRNLRKGNIVRSVRGPGGGYVLAFPTNQITIGQILTSVKETMQYSDTVSKPKKETTEYQLMQKFFKRLDDVVLNELNLTTVEDLIKGN